MVRYLTFNVILLQLKTDRLKPKSRLSFISINFDVVDNVA